MNIREIKEMLQLMAEHDLAEMELEKEGLKIRFKKNSSGKLTAEEYSQLQFRPMPMSSRIEDSLGPVPVSAAAADTATLVKSPMVGTFYSSPAPDQPPYVTVGKQVKEGDVLCIVEAMKLMNEIKSEI
ncbi:MAG: acetyl-CoA carboxylase biotin carboxyl carrier protein, partial [Candidatus Omnitrophota bacterium]